MKKITAYEMALMVADENRPYDYGWLKYIKRHSTEKEMHEWAVDNIKPFVGTFCPVDVSKQFIGRAANELLEIIF